MTDAPDDPGTAAAIDKLRRARIRAALAAERKVEPPGAAAAAEPAAAPAEAAPKAKKPRAPKRTGVPPDAGDGDDYVKPWRDDCPVQVLGHCGGTFYLLDGAGQFVELTRDKLVHAQLRGVFLEHIPYLWQHYPRWKAVKEGMFERVGWRPEQVAESLIVAASAAGVIDPSKMVRGRGAWRGDGGELILHCGDRVIVGPKLDGAEREPVVVAPGRVGARVYPRGVEVPLPFPDPVPAEQSPADELLALLKTWQWARGEVDALFLLGWIGAALIGGALKWRPVVWITGGRGTGKSTLWRLVTEIIGESGILAVADTSAAGIWQTLKISTLPVVVDELENEADGRRVAAVIKLAREAASGTKSLRGGADHQAVEFVIRSCFAFLSIIVPPLPSQDRSRIALLELGRLPAHAPVPELDGEKLAIIGAKLRRRLLDQWWRFNGLLETWRATLEQHGHSARGADQFGTLMAIADLLRHDEGDAFDIEAIAQKIDAAGMSEVADDVDDARAMLGHLLNQVVDPWRNGTRSALYEYVARVVAEPAQGELQGEQEERVTAEQNAARALSLHGLQVTDALGKVKLARTHLAIANQHPALLGIFAGTHWAGRAGTTGPWVQAAKRLDGAAPSQNTVSFAGGAQRAVLVPLDTVLGRGRGGATASAAGGETAPSVPAPGPEGGRQ